MDKLKRLAGDLKARVGGPESPNAIINALREAGIPITTLEDACQSCEDPCDEQFGNLGTYPKKFGIDTTSQMLGSTKPYGRQVIISTGLSNWEREVTDVKGSLAALLNEVDSTLSTKHHKAGAPESLPGFFNTSSSSRLSILNGSHKSISEDHMRQTCIVLPDYKFVTEVVESSGDAERLWKTALDPALGRAGSLLESDGTTSPLSSWPLPYDSVILLCSHKRRDNKCGIAAPILENALTTVLNARDWEVHNQIDGSGLSDPPLEEIFGDAGTREQDVLKRIKETSTEHGDKKRALILQISHIGGHKFAGNVIVYAPSGTAVWYGRVSPKEVPAVVDETIIGGRVIPELLRAGVNVSSSKRSLYDW